MSDRCDVYITLRKDELDRFGMVAGYESGCQWWERLYKEVRAPHLVTVCIPEVNYAFYGARKKACEAGLVYCGTHNGGSEYPPAVFVAAENRMLERRLNQYGQLLTEKDQFVESIQEIKQFEQIMELVANRLLMFHDSFSINRAFPIRQHIKLGPRIFFNYKASSVDFDYCYIRDDVSPETAMSSHLKKIRTVNLPGGVKLEMVWCSPGCFMMGSPVNEEGRGNDETQHLVTITKGFWIGKYPVTNLQFAAVMGAIISEDSHGANFPSESMERQDCEDFIFNLNATFRKNSFRLPTEAEWEYACRAGTLNSFSGNREDMGWYGDNSSGRKHEVGKKCANAWGLYDMHGNVWEQCQDSYGTYPFGNVKDPKGTNQGKEYVFRGGCFYEDPNRCRSASREAAFGFWINHGMRLAMDQESTDEKLEQKTKNWLDAMNGLDNYRSLPATPSEEPKTDVVDRVSSDDVVAYEWYLHAASQGDVDAQHEIGRMYAGYPCATKSEFHDCETYQKPYTKTVTKEGIVSN